MEEPEDQSEVKRARVISNTSQEGNAASSPSYVEDDSIMKRMLPKLQEERDERRGNRLNPEPPRLVAKVCKEKGKGELWLGPLPTAQRMDRITETKHSIQVYCFQKQPTEVQVEPGGEEGMLIPGTVVFRCEMSNRHTRLADMRVLKPCLVNSLRQGDNAYVHCVSGISRAAMAAAVMSSILMGISFEKAKDIINQTRNVSFDKAEQRMQGAWIDGVIREGVTNAVVPTGFSCRISNPEEVVVHATASVNGGTEPICRWKKGAAGKQDFKSNTITVDSVEQAANQFSGRFCVNCDEFYG